jgi:L-fucose isomerase-like protein
MKKSVKIGIFSGYDPRPWVMEQSAGADAKTLEKFVRRLRKAGFDIVYPGEQLGKKKLLCHSIPLANKYAAIFAEQDCAILINVHQTWTFPQLSQKVITGFIRQKKAADPAFVPRIIIASIQDTNVPGMVSGMALGGALTQTGIAFVHIAGYFDSDGFFDELREAISFYTSMALTNKQVHKVVAGLSMEHMLEFGSFSLQMPTTRIDHEEIMGRWGISGENLDQQVFLDRAFEMFDWSGTPGKSDIIKVHDSRVKKDCESLYDGFPEKFKAIPSRSVPREKFLLQLAIYHAIADIAGERGATAVTIKCQDECSANYCTCCMATAFLANDRGTDGKSKQVIPASCETDLPTLLTQLFLFRLSGKPAGFGDFRYVKTDRDTTILAIVNCGQHPPAFAGRENQTWTKKLSQIEFPAQEHFYRAGGSAVRMRTAGKQEITVARLGVENNRLHIVATIMDTRDVKVSRHKAYNEAWPIIEGTIPVSDKVISSRWPSNHLGFVYGDYLPHLVELSEQLGIGYTIWDRGGKHLYKPS